MTIASEITRIKNNIAGAYTALSAKGATLPATQNSANLATTVASVPAGSSETVTATNSSSYDRVSGEKVWLNKSGDNYSIINYASADINSLIGTCKQNIAIGASGSVETLDNGTIVPHLTRNFIVPADASSVVVDDTNKLLTINSYAASSTTLNNFICSNQIEAAAGVATDLTIKLKFKILPNDVSNPPDLSQGFSGLYNLLVMSPTNSTSYPSDYNTGYYNPYLFIVYDKIRSFWKTGSNQDASAEVAFGDIIGYDKWISITIASSGSVVLYVSDDEGHSNQYTANVGPSSNTAIERAYIGQLSSNTTDVKLIYDLSQCGLYKASDNSEIWVPYIETEG